MHSTAAAVPAPRLELLAVGQLFLDVLYGPLAQAPAPGEEVFSAEVALVPGGIANFALTASALGLRTGISAPIGDGPASALATAVLDREDVDGSHLQPRAAWDLQVTSAFAYDGERSLVTGGPAPVELEPPLSVDADYMALHLELEEMPWLADCPAHVVGDVGWDPSGRWDRAILRHLEHCFAFIPNAAEAQAYTGTETPLLAARALAEHVPVVVVTCGADGAIGIDSRTGTEVSVPALDLGPVDPTGAGDTFGAALIASWARGLDLAQAVEVAALTATARAAGLAGQGRTPRPEHLIRFARDRGLPVVEALHVFL